MCGNDRERGRMDHLNELSCETDTRFDHRLECFKFHLDKLAFMDQRNLYHGIDCLCGLIARGDYWDIGRV